MATVTQLVQTMQQALTQGDTPLFTTSTCFYGFDPMATLQAPPSDQYAVIQPTTLEVHDRAWAGSSKTNYLVTWRCTLWIFVRLGTDEAHHDDNYLLDAVNGSLALTDNVIQLFQDYEGTSTVPGYQLDSVTWGTRDRQATGWGVTQLKYHSALAGRGA